MFHPSRCFIKSPDLCVIKANRLLEWLAFVDFTEVFFNEYRAYSYTNYKLVEGR